MLGKSSSLGLGALMVLALAAAGCSDSDSSDKDGDTDDTSATVRVEVFSWWTAPGESEALQALIDLHKDNYPKERIYNAASDPKVTSGGDEAKALLKMRLADGDPPDAFQTNAYELTTFEPGLLAPLDELFDAEGLTDDVAPEILRDVTVDGHILGVPVNVHRSNGLFYNQTVFTENGLEPPQTMADFFDVCEKLKAAGITPLAISTSQGWIMEKVMQSLAVAKLGPEGYIEYFVKKTPIDEAIFAPVADVLDQVLTDYIDVDKAAMDGYGWTQAADALHDGEAGMFIHGDWAKGYLTQLGWTPGVDFGVVATPDAGGAFIYGMDVFGIPAGAPHLEAAEHFVSTIASADGQVAFNEFKGSSPVRLNVPMKGLDPMARGIYADFQSSEYRIAEVALPGAWDDAVVKLAQDHDKAAYIQTLIDNPL